MVSNVDRLRGKFEYVGVGINLVIACPQATYIIEVKWLYFYGWTYIPQAVNHYWLAVHAGAHFKVLIFASALDFY